MSIKHVIDEVKEAVREIKHPQKAFPPRPILHTAEHPSTQNRAEIISSITSIPTIPHEHTGGDHSGNSSGAERRPAMSNADMSGSKPWFRIYITV